MSRVRISLPVPIEMKKVMDQWVKFTYFRILRGNIPANAIAICRSPTHLIVDRIQNISGLEVERLQEFINNGADITKLKFMGVMGRE